MAAEHRRRKVTVGGFPATVVDMHAHCEIKAIEPVVSGTPLERKVRGSRILGPERLALLDARGIDIQAVHKIAIGSPERSRQSAIVAPQMHDQTALDSGRLQDLPCGCWLVSCRRRTEYAASYQSQGRDRLV